MSGEERGEALFWFGKLRLAALIGSSVAFRKRRQRLISWTLLSAIVLLVLGIPLPSSPVSKSTSEPFPCQHCACSCQSAARCWDKCCCHTDSEKLAWAARNGVQPPAFLVARVSRATSLVTFEDDASAPHNSADVVKVATAQRPRERSSCCDKAKHASPSDDVKLTEARDDNKSGARQVASDSKSPASTKSVLLWDAVRKCKGIELAVKLISNSLVARGEQKLAPEPLLLFVSPLFNERLLSGFRLVEPPVP